LEVCMEMIHILLLFAIYYHLKISLNEVYLSVTLFVLSELISRDYIPRYGFRLSATLFKT